MALPTLTAQVAVSASVKTGVGTVWMILVEPTANAGSIVIRDGGASGTVMITITVPAGADPYPVPFNVGLKCGTTIYCAVSICVAVVHYS